MSSATVRTEIKNFLSTESSESVIDISAQFEDFKDMLVTESIPTDAPWLGLEFIGDNELPVQLAATNDQGQYRETGSVVLHVCAVAKIGVGDSILTRGEVLRDLFRGRRIGSVVIESVAPVNFGRGATLEFEGGYVSGSITISYYRDNNL